MSIAEEDLASCGGTAIRTADRGVQVAIVVNIAHVVSVQKNWHRELRPGHLFELAVASTQIRIDELCTRKANDGKIGTTIVC